MKKILIVYSKMVIGGSTTALLSILNNIDYTRYEVELLLIENGGELYDHIPKDVKILKPIFPRWLKILLYPITLFYKYKYREEFLKGIQKSSQLKIYFLKAINQEYDLAIAFLELMSTYYLVKKVKSNKKVAWVHIDYDAVNLDPKLDYYYYKNVNEIVLVSDKCKLSFDKNFVDFSHKTHYIENVISTDLIKSRSTEALPEGFLSKYKNKCVMTTVCRIDNSSKALDRMVEVFLTLRNSNLDNNLVWWIIGDGPDFQKLKTYIDEHKLDNIVLLGNQINPYKYLLKSNFLLLPSKYEGKPISVTEAMILGIPPIVTEYSSSHEQIKHGINGLILENSAEGLYDGLKELLNNIDILNYFRLNLNKETYSNLENMNDIYNLIDKLTLE